jgi:hypothetical protein
MEPSEAVEAAINKWVDKLDRAYPTIITCRVSIAAPSKKKLHGGLYTPGLTSGFRERRWW